MKIYTKRGTHEFTKIPLGITSQHGGNGQNLFIIDSEDPDIPYCMITKIHKKYCEGLPAEEVQRHLCRMRPPFKIDFLYQVAKEAEGDENFEMELLDKETVWQKLNRYLSTGSFYVIHFLTIPFCLIMGWFFLGVFIADLVKCGKSECDVYVYWNGISLIMMGVGLVSTLAYLKKLVLMFDLYIIIFGTYQLITGVVLSVKLSSDVPCSQDCSEPTAGEIFEFYFSGLCLLGGGILRFKYWWWKFYPRLTPEDLAD